METHPGLLLFVVFAAASHGGQSNGDGADVSARGVSTVEPPTISSGLGGIAQSNFERLTWHKKFRLWVSEKICRSTISRAFSAGGVRRGRVDARARRHAELPRASRAEREGSSRRRCAEPHRSPARRSARAPDAIPPSPSSVATRAIRSSAVRDGRVATAARRPPRTNDSVARWRRVPACRLLMPVVNARTRVTRLTCATP